MTEKRGSWHLLTGAILGFLLGLLISLVAARVPYFNTDPSTLSEKDKAVYRLMVAQAYLVEGDATRAVSRLTLLQDQNPAEILIAQAQGMLANGGSETQARALALLAAAVNQPSLAITPLAPQNPLAVQNPDLAVTFTPVVALEGTPGATRTPGPSSTPRPTLTPQATAGSPFVLEEEPIKDCDPLPEKPLLQITVLDAADQPVAGVKIEISQPGGGVETFFTGLYPAINRGYADYEMLPGVNYTIRVGDAGQPVTDLSAPDCSGSQDYGSLWLVFQQP